MPSNAEAPPRYKLVLYEPGLSHRRVDRDFESYEAAQDRGRYLRDTYQLFWSMRKVHDAPDLRYQR